MKRVWQVASNGIKLTVHSRLNGTVRRRPVLLLAGTGETAADWNCIAADLARDRMVHAVDLRGHGLSSWPGEYSIQAMADDVMELLPALGGPVDLVGHSLGGLVAAHAAQDSQWVSRLVLEDVGLPRPRIPSTPTRPEGALEFDWAMVEQIRPQIDQPDFPWEQIFSNIKVPTEIISGGRESFVPAELVEQLGGLIPDCSISTLQTGHLVHATDPDGFIRLVRAHLDGR